MSKDGACAINRFRTLTSWLQNAGRLWHTVADLASLDQRDRLAWLIVGCRCGQDCGQPVWKSSLRWIYL
jgi:hypothetical protein